MVASVAVAGCTATRTNPSLSLLGEGDCPWLVNARLTNGDGGPINVNSTGFKMVDANGTAVAVDSATTLSFTSNSFPRAVRLNNSDNASGLLAFAAQMDAPPYTLKYEHDGVRTEVRLNDLSAGDDACSGEAWLRLRPNLTMAAGAWNGGNLTVSISAAAYASYLWPMNLTFLVAAPDGTVYFSGAAGAEWEALGVTVEVAYQDTTEQGTVSAGDSVRITVTPSSSTAISGGSLRVFTASGDFAGSLDPLPPPS